MQQPFREHFDYCWPGDAKIIAIEVVTGQLSVRFDRFTMSLDDPWNKSREDLILGECACVFEAPTKTEFRLWPDDRDYHLEKDLTRLLGCTLEDSGDMPSDNGHYFELSGFCDSEWFEFRIYSDRFELAIAAD